MWDTQRCISTQKITAVRHLCLHWWILCHPSKYSNINFIRLILTAGCDWTLLCVDVSWYLSCPSLSFYLRKSGATWWQKAQLTLRCLSRSLWWHWTVYWNVPSATTATVRSEHRRHYSSNIFLLCCASVSSSCSVSRSTSEYVSAIVELSDLIIDRRQRILHHWDWIYWRTQQGKRFRKALSVVHKYGTWTGVFM